MAEPMPRLNFVFAAESPVAVILRRGPSKWVHLLKWNTIEETVEAGAWFHGRIYEERCDLSPDGSLFYYFAAQFGQKREAGYEDIWSAVSKPPWLTALALWPTCETWGGDGYFADDSLLVIDRPHWDGPLVPHPKHLPQRLKVIEHWIGTGAPEAELPKPCRKTARFDTATGKGIDRQGRSFRVEEGQLLRENDGVRMVIADFRTMKPHRTRSPEWARSW